MDDGRGSAIFWGRVQHLVGKVGLLCASLVVSSTATLAARRVEPLPDWAESRWRAVARTRSLTRSAHLTPDVQRGDFDGDGAEDIAVLAETTTSHKVGVVFLHRRDLRVYVVGVGRTLGNGGDNLDWADSWKVQARVQKSSARRTDAVLLEREGSGAGLLYFAGGAYHWRQVGD